MNLEFPYFSFKLQYFDSTAELIRDYILTYYTERDEIEIFDVKNHRVFLRKTLLHSLTLQELYPTGRFYLNGRQYIVTDYANDFTRDSLSNVIEHTYAMLKPGFHSYLGQTIERILDSGLKITNLQFGNISKAGASQFYAEHQGKPFYDELVQYISSGPIVAIELAGLDAIVKWRQIIGPTNVEVARREKPNSLRALYAKSTTQNFAHGSDSPKSANRELAIIFGGKALSSTYQITDCSLLIVKPHVFSSGVAGKIISEIVASGLKIGAAKVHTLDMIEAEEFFEAYRGVLEEYTMLVEEITSGPCLAIQIIGENAVENLRAICGPRDSKVAKLIRPKSIRAKYGIDSVRNAVHCTDLAEDSQAECEYFFKLLQLTSF